MKRYIALAFVLCLVCACGGEPTPRPTTKSVSPSKTYDVTLKITGTAKDTYVAAHGMSGCGGIVIADEVVRPPWQKSITCKPGPGNVSVTVHFRQGSPGTLKCEIWVDNTLKESESKTGSDGFFSCTWWLP